MKPEREKKRKDKVPDQQHQVRMKLLAKNSMPYFETTMMLAPEMEHAEIVNLKRILELCTLPNVGKSPLDPNLTVEGRCMNALTTLEKTTSVFDDAFYQDAVFTGELDEDKLDRHLMDSARRKGVPEEHFPAKCMRNPPPCPVPQGMSRESVRAAPAGNRRAVTTGKLVKMASEKNLPALPSRVGTSHDDREGRSLTRPSLSLPSSFRKVSKSSLNGERSRATSPAPSFFSSFSSKPSSPRVKGKDSLLSLFKRDLKSPRIPEYDPPPPPTEVPSLVSSSSSRTTPRLSGTNTRNSHLSSSPSTSISSRNSTSSVSIVDLSAYSWVDGRTIQRMSRNPGFIILRVRCINEAKRFVDFAQHQRVALPLFLGRTKMYLEDRLNHKVAELQKKHDRIREDVENKHLEQELFEIDEHSAQTADEAVKNATALKYIARRMDLLGDQATENDHNAYISEARALDRLAEKHQREIRNLHRFQYREKQDMQRNQQKEMEDMKDEAASKIKSKTSDLERNSRKLEELIHIRCMRLVARWHLMLQIYKTEDRDGISLKGALPLSLLGLPEEFAPYVSAYHI